MRNFQAVISAKYEPVVICLN